MIRVMVLAAAYGVGLWLAYVWMRFVAAVFVCLWGACG